MKVSEKQKRVKCLLNKIRPDISICFDNNKRITETLGEARPGVKEIRLCRPLWNYTLNACFHCMFHELAHIVQYEITGSMPHNKQFRGIMNKLIEDYGTPTIVSASRLKSLCYADYKRDI